MSVVILGGNECMVRRYIDVCSEFRCKAKVYAKMSREMQDIGNPDLLVMFTDTISHKMVRSALNETKGQNTRIVRSHSSSVSALKNILLEHAKGCFS